MEEDETLFYNTIVKSAELANGSIFFLVDSKQLYLFLYFCFLYLVIYILTFWTTTPLTHYNDKSLVYYVYIRSLYICWLCGDNRIQHFFHSLGSSCLLFRFSPLFPNSFPSLFLIDTGHTSFCTVVLPSPLECLLPYVRAIYFCLKISINAFCLQPCGNSCGWLIRVCVHVGAQHNR